MKLTTAERLAREEQKLARLKHEATAPTRPPAASLAPVPIIEWTSCYDKGWRGFLVDAAFSHPAKAARGLLDRIYDHLFAIGALRKGGTAVDPFGGIFTTGIVGAWRGVSVIGCELEEKFVVLARENIALHAHGLTEMGLPLPVIVQGDSRRLRAHVQKQVDAIVSSPPYADQGLQGGDQGNVIGKGRRSVGGMKAGDVDVIISSPPYADLGANIKGHGIVGAGVSHDPKYGEAEYGQTDGQLGGMKADDVDVIISSPPYINTKPEHFTGDDSQRVDELIRSGQMKGHPRGEHATTSEEYGQTDGQLSGMKAGDVDVIISSPPYAEIASGAGGLNTKAGSEGQQSGRNAHAASQDTDQRYGDSDGQLAKLPKGEVDAIIASPPYSEGLGHGGTPTVRGGKEGDVVLDAMQTGYGDTDGQLGGLPSGDVDAIISSPPYAETILSGGGGIANEMRNTYRDGQNYGDHDAQLGAMKADDTVDAVISSPPYLDQQMSGSESPEAKIARLTAEGNLEDAEKIRRNHSGPASNLRQLDYGHTDGQIGMDTHDTFWSAAREIVRESYAILKTGGVAVWIVKAFVRDRQIVDFPTDWRKLCEHCGFETVTEVHAMLVTETTDVDLFGNEDTTRKEKKSFFRRLAEKKGSPPIDYEVIWIMRKP